MVRTRKSSTLTSISSDAERPSKRVKLDESETPTRVPKPKRQPKSKEIDVSDAPTRVKSLWKVGAHVSSAGGVENSILNAVAIGANAFALFLKSQRKWSSPPLTDKSIKAFKSLMEEHGYSNKDILPHGSYLINLGNADQEKREKSYECFVDDLKRCEQLGISLYNFHPGSTVGSNTVAECISLIAGCINRAHEETKGVTIVLENMAGAGNVIGSEFKQIGSIIEQVKDKSRVGVCLDTCHMFAAGYDIRTKAGWDKMMTQFDKEIGLSYLRGMHFNDSKTELGSKRDRHESVGLGYIGLAAFHHVLTDHRTQGIPLVLETPSFELPKVVWKTEVDVLYRLGEVENVETDEKVMTGLVSEVRDAVTSAEKTNPKKTKAPAKKPAGKRKKGKGKDESDEDSKDGDHSC